MIPNFKRWWEHTPDQLMGFAYWQKGQLPPIDNETWQKEWQKLKQQLLSRFGRE